MTTLTATIAALRERLLGPPYCVEECRIKITDLSALLEAAELVANAESEPGLLARFVELQTRLADAELARDVANVEVKRQTVRADDKRRIALQAEEKTRKAEVDLAALKSLFQGQTGAIDYDKCLSLSSELATVKAELAAIKLWKACNGCMVREETCNRLSDEIARLKAANAEVEATFDDLRHAAQVTREKRDEALKEAAAWRSAVDETNTLCAKDGYAKQLLVDKVHAELAAMTKERDDLQAELGTSETQWSEAAHRAKRTFNLQVEQVIKERDEARQDFANERKIVQAATADFIRMKEEIASLKANARVVMVKLPARHEHEHASDGHYYFADDVLAMLERAGIKVEP